MMHTHFKKKPDGSNAIRKYIVIFHLNLYILPDLTDVTCFEECYSLKFLFKKIRKKGVPNSLNSTIFGIIFLL